MNEAAKYRPVADLQVSTAPRGLTFAVYREEPDQRRRWWAACSASCGRVDGRLDVDHRRPVDCLQSVDFDPELVARQGTGAVRATIAHL
jgi:hypothetical protein